jgi:hypothetical protein
LLRIDINSYLLLHMLDNMLEVVSFHMFLSLFNHLGFNTFQAGNFKLVLFGFLNVNRGSLSQLDLNARGRFFFSWLGRGPGCCFFELERLRLFGLRFWFGFLFCPFEGRP